MTGITSGPAKGGGKTPIILGAIFGAVVLLGLRACDEDKKPAASTVVTTTPTPVTPERKAHFIAVALSANTLKYAEGADRAAVEKKALGDCEAARRERFARGSYIAKEGCSLLPMVSNYDGTSCLAAFQNPLQYNTPIRYIVGSPIDIDRNIRAFLHSAEGRLYNHVAHPDAETYKFCVDYYGRPSIETPGYHLSR